MTNDSLNLARWQKAEKRLCFQNILTSMSEERRESAAALAFHALSTAVQTYRSILSFSSLHDELSLENLNHLLAQRGQLLLPKVKEKELLLFKVMDVRADLICSNWNILEPKAHCEEVSVDCVDLILAPALAFDLFGNRLGRGFGYYDRLLNKSKSPVYGVGFKEQLSWKELPREDHDAPLCGIFLF